LINTLVLPYLVDKTISLSTRIPNRRYRINFVFFALLVYLILRGSVGVILTKAPVMRISIPVDLSSRSFLPLPSFIRSRRPIGFSTHHSFFRDFFLSSSLDFFILIQIILRRLSTRKNAGETKKGWSCPSLNPTPHMHVTTNNSKFSVGVMKD
jgi:hypothetical protein